MKFQGFVGPTYQLDSVNVDCQRCVNLYPELVESGTGKEGQQYYYRSTPGLEELFTVGDGPIRGIFVDPINRLMVISGNKMYLVTYNGVTWSSTLKGTLSTATGPVKAESWSQYNDANNYNYTTMFVDGTYVYQYLDVKQAGFPIEGFAMMEGSVSTPPPHVAFPAEGATHVVYIDGYLVFAGGRLLNKFLSSGWNTPSNIDPLDYASAEGSPDNIVAAIVNHRDIWFLNQESAELFQNVGNPDFPFERVSGGFIEIGCVAPYSVAKIDGVVFWLGRDESGQGTVYAAQGLSPQRISTHAIEKSISGYADISTATAYTRKAFGHSFFVLNFAEATWAYDLSTKMWHELAYTNDGELERHRADCHTFFAEYDLHLAGDYENGKVYKFSESTYTDNGDAITRMRVSPHMSASGNMMFYHRLLLDIETGVGLDGGVLGSDPQVMLDFSNDGGHTWSSEDWTSLGNAIGQIGDFKKRVAWRRLGKARDRVFRIKITDPVKVTILGAELDLEVGTS